VFNVADMAIVLGLLVGVLTLRMVPAAAARGDGDHST
jgi:lipoprotein signal peptidase